MKMRCGKNEFMKEMMEQLNLTAEQVTEVEKLKSSSKKEKFALIVKHIIGRAKPQDMLKIVLAKIEKAEGILTPEQNTKLREIMINKHKEMFMHFLMSKHQEIKDIIEELGLSEEQKDKVESLFSEAGNIDCFELKEKLDSVLSEEQKDKAKEQIKIIMEIDRIFEELGITEAQKEQLKKLHEKLHLGAKETIDKFRKGEVSLSEIAKEKFELFNELENILTKEQFKKIHKFHKCGHHRHCCA